MYELDAGVWIGHLRIADSNDQAPSFKLPARLLLEEHYPERLAAVPVLDERIVRADFPLPVLFPPEGLELGWVIDGQIGYLYFEFYNGAMSTRQCRAFGGLSAALLAGSLHCRAHGWGRNFGLTAFISR